MWLTVAHPHCKTQLNNISVTVVSITRLVYLVTLDINDPDVTWVFRMPQIWTCVELNVAVLCGCLPQLRPLLQLITTGSFAGSTHASGGSSGITGNSSGRDPKSMPTGSALDTNTASIIGDDTRPLVIPASTKSAGYIELQNADRGNMKDVIPRKNGGAWDIRVKTDWNLSSNSSTPTGRV